jgi:thiol:disulfide interchange protein
MTSLTTRFPTRRFPISLTLACVCLAAILLSVYCAREKGEGAATGGAINWLTSFDTAVASARQKNLPVMIDFYTDWCGWCKKLDADTYVDKQVVDLAKGFVSLKIDADAERAITSRYGITGFPTILFVDTAGNEIHRIVGYRPPEAFVSEMNQALRAFKARS